MRSFTEFSFYLCSYTTRFATSTTASSSTYPRPHSTPHAPRDSIHTNSSPGPSPPLFASASALGTPASAHLSLPRHSFPSLNSQQAHTDTSPRPSHFTSLHQPSSPSVNITTCHHSPSFATCPHITPPGRPAARRRTRAGQRSRSPIPVGLACWVRKPNENSTLGWDQLDPPTSPRRRPATGPHGPPWALLTSYP